jgi:hypothetical protein
MSVFRYSPPGSEYALEVQEQQIIAAFEKNRKKRRLPAAPPKYEHNC